MSLVQITVLKEQLQSTDNDIILTSLQQIQPITSQITASILKQTQLGIVINKLRKHDNNDISTLAKNILNELKNNVVNQTNINNNNNSNTLSQSPLPSRSPTRDNNIKKRELDSTTDTDTSSIKRHASSSTSNNNNHATAQTQSQSDDVNNNDKINLTLSEPTPELGKTGDTFRDTIQQKLLDGLELDGKIQGNIAIRCAIDIEHELYIYSKQQVNSTYKTKYRELAMNICDRNNPDLRSMILSGELSVYSLLHKPITELASKAVKQEREAEQKELWEARRTDLDMNKGTTDAFRCGKCKQSKCTYYQMQTRSADEPMTTFVRCVNCGNRWKC